MNVFKLVLCLAGLMIYLVVKQFMHSDAVPQAPERSLPASSPSSDAQQMPRSSRPQTTPYIEVLKPESTYVDAKR